MRLHFLLLLLPSLLLANGSITYNVNMDASIYSDQTLNQGGELANGAGDFLFAGTTRDTITNIRRALLHFDVQAGDLPMNAQIDAVTLLVELNAEAFINPPAASFYLHRVTRQWHAGPTHPAGGPTGDKEGAGANATNGDVTWTFSRYDTDPGQRIAWTNPGGDYQSTPSATTSMNNPDSYQISSQGLVDDVNDWMANPGNNFGWILVADETEFATARRFLSSVDEDVGPRLRIDYSILPIPEPAIGILTFVGAAVMIAKRKRRRTF